MVWLQFAIKPFPLFYHNVFDYMGFTLMFHRRGRGPLCGLNIYSGLSLFRPRLSRITAYLEVKIWSLPKHENLATGKKILWKRGGQYFQYISKFKIKLHIHLLNVVVRIIFSSILQILYVEVRISRSISESPLEFEITRVDCICNFDGLGI